MIFFPSFLLYIGESSNERRVALTPLESFLCLNSGLLLATLAAALLFNVCFIYNAISRSTNYRLRLPHLMVYGFPAVPEAILSLHLLRVL